MLFKTATARVAAKGVEGAKPPARTVLLKILFALESLARLVVLEVHAFE